jgi:retron-type reverse transcriptase
VLVLAPIFEADLQPEQYAYREGRNAHDAVRHVHKLLNTGHTAVIDADLSGYFDTIPHAELMQSVARRIQASLRSRDAFWDVQVPKTHSIFDGH